MVAHIPEVLKNLRLLQGFKTLSSFSRAVGITRNQVCRLEDGKMAPGISTLEKMSHPLRTNVSEILRLAEDPTASRREEFLFVRPDVGSRVSCALRDRARDLDLRNFELVDLLGVGHGYICQILKGKRGSPHLASLERWAVALKTSVHEIVRRAEIG